MRTLTIGEAQGQLYELITAAHQGEAIVLTDGEKNVTLHPSALIDLDEDSPELEMALLEALDGPLMPQAPRELRAVGESIIREQQKE